MLSLAETWDLMPPGRNPCRLIRHYREQLRECFLTPEGFRRVGATLQEVEVDGSIWPLSVDADRVSKERDPEAALGRCGPYVREGIRIRGGKSGPRMMRLATSL